LTILSLYQKCAFSHANILHVNDTTIIGPDLSILTSFMQAIYLTLINFIYSTPVISVSH